ncbi:itaconyl-CoA hydratase [Streptomyces sp. MnatMP-M77]|uniref:MaoC family dehydratase n=1 Tax=unclassified Streptomyces TaxID=2593676 RepID=UPI000804D872|nr:MaoC family dehydratase [Streptomyces sp. MnatMP-M77]SBU96489.1 itaconyl-CoA hydratase [Streptomyces sp. MnatMP-M77]
MMQTRQPMPVPAGFRTVEDGRVREVVGLGLDDLKPGLVIEHRPARTVTETEHVQVLALMGNEAPVHSDIEYCRRTGHQRVLVCGMLTLNIVLGMTVRSTSGMTTGNLALDAVSWTAPVHVGDTLSARSTVLAARRSGSRPDQGIVTCRVDGFNQRGELVVTGTRTFFVPADPDVVRDATGY